VAAAGDSGGDVTYYRYAGLGLGGGAVIFGLILAGGLCASRRFALLILTGILSVTLLASCDHDDDPATNYETYTIVALDSGTTYYWAIVAKDNNDGATPSAVWSYTTR